MLMGCILTMLPTSAVRAQELEYALELGVKAGPMVYFGDANYGSPLKNINASAGIFARYNLNQRMSLKFDVAYGKISGDASNGKNKFPANPTQEWKFSKPLVDVACLYELGFWAYGTGGSYKGSHRLAPYIQMGLGVTACNKQVALNIPLGIGVKYKFAPRWNCGADFSVRFTTGDKFDGIEDPYRISSGAFKNKDSYAMLMFYVAYDLCPKYRKCNNE
jgi:hypothetical protein